MLLRNRQVPPDHQLRCLPGWWPFPHMDGAAHERSDQQSVRLAGTYGPESVLSCSQVCMRTRHIDPVNRTYKPAGSELACARFFSVPPGFFTEALHSDYFVTVRCVSRGARMARCQERSSSAMSALVQVTKWAGPASAP